MDFWTYLITTILSLDTFRAVIAMTGVVKHSWKYSWIIYGQYDKNLLCEVFESLGYSNIQAQDNIRQIENLAKGVGITKENADIRLVSLMSHITVKFDNPITYGGQSLTESSYYINTMEASQDAKMRKEMASLMYYLIEKYDDQKPDFILTPKGGNPIMAQAVAAVLGCPLIIAKEAKDKSKAQVEPNAYTKDTLRINYEGANSIVDYHGTKPLRGILVDCNTSGGSQLLNIVENFGEIIQACGLNVERPSEAYVLFRADVEKVDIDQKFRDCGCTLHRYFDLDEEIKGRIYGNGKGLSCYMDDQKETIASIISMMKERNYYYYK